MSLYSKPVQPFLIENDIDIINAVPLVLGGQPENKLVLISNNSVPNTESLIFVEIDLDRFNHDPSKPFSENNPINPNAVRTILEATLCTLINETGKPNLLIGMIYDPENTMNSGIALFECYCKTHYQDMFDAQLNKELVTQHKGIILHRNFLFYDVINRLCDIYDIKSRMIFAVGTNAVTNLSAETDAPNGHRNVLAIPMTEIQKRAPKLTDNKE